MKYEALGKLIKSEREKRGWDQAELAARLEIGQQAVSRWEKGGSRPRVDALHKMVELFEGDINDWLPKAGYRIEKPVRPLSPFLPLDHLSEESFELFSRDFIQALHPGVDVHRYGKRGHKQDGIDLYAKLKDGKLDYQCKRHKQFGPADIDAAVAATTLEAKHHHLLLSRIASPDARKAIDKQDDWSLWDVDDISGKVQRDLPKDVAVRIVDTYFPGWRKDFLGVDEPSPWLTPEQFYQPLVNRRRIFSHGWSFVGRQKELEALDKFASQEETRVIIVSGRGGIGKSRLLRAWADATIEKSRVVFVSSGSEIEAKHLELLPQGKAFLVIDDAHDRSDMLSILSGVALTRPQMMTVVSTRPYGLTRIQDELTRSGMGYEHDGTVTLSDLSEDDAASLAKEVIEGAQGDIQYAKRIAEITKDCPLATVVGSRLVAEGSIKPDLLNNSEKFREELLRSFRNIVTGEVGGKDADAVRDLLNIIAMIQPFDPNDPNFQEAAKKVLERRFDRITRDMRALEDAGVLLRRSRRLRIAPDLLADYIRADASYDDRNKRPTGYVDTVFSVVKNDLATNLLANLSQLDWRLSADGAQTALLDEVWANLEAQFKESKIFGRQALLKALAKIAYYQPQQALKFVRLALDNPIDDIEEDAKPYLLGRTSYRYVTDEIAPLLRYVAYHDIYLNDALDLLKTLADSDPRPQNQNPNHPIRILRDLASIEPNKSLYFNDLIVRHVLPWLAEPVNERFSPFEVLDALLATEGHESETQGITLSLRGFKVNAKAVAGLRQKIIDAAFDQLLDQSPQKAFRALETIEHSLEFPHGLVGMEITKKDSDSWEPGIVATLERLERVISGNKLDPFLMVQIRGSISGHARWNKGATKAAAGKVLDAIPVTREYEVARALADGWGWTFEREGGTMRNEELCAKWRDKLAAELLTEHKTDYAGLIQMLEDLAARMENMPIRSKDYGPFIGALMRQSPDFTAVLGEHLLDNPDSPLVGAFGIAIMVLAKDDYSKGIALAKRAVETKDVVLARSTSRALGWSLYDLPVMPDEEDVIKALTASDDYIVRHNITRIVKRYASEAKTKALRVLTSIRFDDSKEVADEVLGEIGKHGAFEVSDLSVEHLQHLHEQLLECKSIEGYNIETYISDLSAEYPERAVKLLMERVEHKEVQQSKDEEKYKPLPYVHRNGPALRVSETKSYEELLRQIRDWTAVKTDNWIRPHYGADLFKMVSAGFDETTLKVLQEWIMSGDAGKLEAAASLLSEADPSFVFTNHEYVIDLLEQAKKQSESSYERVTSWLYGAAISGSRTGTPGQPFPRDIEQRDRSYGLMSQLPAGSPAHKFYKLLYDAAKANIERDTIEDFELE